MNKRERLVTDRRGESPPLNDALLRKLELFFDLSHEQTQFLTGACHRESTLDAGQPIVRAGEVQDAVYVLSEGWAVRYRILPDGSRQIANFVLPGDFIGLTACIFPVADHSIDSVTPVRLAHYRVADIITMTQQHPLLCAAIYWCNAREESMLLEHLANVGRRNAKQRVAHILLELSRRLELVLPGRATAGKSVEFPLTLDLIADAIGLTSVHVSRTIKELDALGLIVSRRVHGRWHVRLVDVRALSNFAGFTDEYLHFTEIPKSTQALLRSIEAERNHIG